MDNYQHHNSKPVVQDGPSQVTHELDQLKRLAESLTGVEEMLFTRLNKVLYEFPQHTSTRDEAKQTLVPLAEDISSVNYKIADHILALQSLVDAIQL